MKHVSNWNKKLSKKWKTMEIREGKTKEMKDKEGKQWQGKSRTVREKWKEKGKRMPPQGHNIHGI